jgi:Na+/H+ antiporter NhaD/arsenite permease-like protein
MHLQKVISKNNETQFLNLRGDMIELFKNRKKLLWVAILVSTFCFLAFVLTPAAHASRALKTIEKGVTKVGEKGDEVLAKEKAKKEKSKHGEGESLGSKLPLWAGIPFLGILLSIALFPLFAPKIWHYNFGKISVFWSLLMAIPFLLVYKSEALHAILHIYLLDYIPFIILLGALFTISGGLVVYGTPAGKPSVNTIMLLIGTLIASWVGTTGASMLLIRPVIRANKWRKHKAHIIIFFIFLVSNIGGSLTPLGDPPLFLGFLHGVPFFWTFRLAPHMFLVSAFLLVLFYLIDRNYFKKEEKPLEAPADQTPGGLKIRGLINLLFLAGVLGGVIYSGFVHLRPVKLLGIDIPGENLARDSILVLMAILSITFTSKKLREDNEFTWFPIKEVAFLFAGIFMTIIPVLAILKAGVNGSMGFIMELVKTPAHYFWAAGALSSFLDNAPTYLTFMNTALGSFFPGIAERQAVSSLISQMGIYLKAISVGAVFMGANTYIGNAPNFMVRSIAEENGIPMPSFFGYMFKYSIPILIPLFIIVTLVFFT